MVFADQGLKWSDNPGAYEVHLIRRNNNYYFPKSRQIISQKELEEAQEIDRQDFNYCMKIFTQILRDLEGASSPTTSGALLNLRERLDDLIILSCGVGGPAADIEMKAESLRSAIISDLYAGFSNDEAVLKNISKANALHQDHMRKFCIPVMAQISRKNSPIPNTESIPTIVSEDPHSIAVAISVIPEDIRAIFKVEALTLLRDAFKEGYNDPLIMEKISALT